MLPAVCTIFLRTKRLYGDGSIQLTCYLERRFVAIYNYSDVIGITVLVFRTSN